ncbi:hypothetical protein CfE428DRAFT_2735 [Chthoniobacter flavus Ellin428]|uniref:Uncharacterized protein n=1 Tax=Chthoniobacter flavus Ellin428 TaxID=497964 RepID=B4D1E7_9BACT|nr:hypothetical protein [Chthoniobacter flavus]EDY19559.1 hypothetical protein CfE428DRAFT_2735 [Chthoniobacter flavus Ellin428]TCO92803.1 hypothetical protein EV701_10580 [Chthoniobacter flavus]
MKPRRSVVIFWAAILLYALSIGPAARIGKGDKDYWIPPLSFDLFYAPLFGAAKVIPHGNDLLEKYWDFWTRGENSNG